jgi:hypothetical protein
VRPPCTRAVRGKSSARDTRNRARFSQWFHAHPACTSRMHIPQADPACTCCRNFPHPHPACTSPIARTVILSTTACTERTWRCTRGCTRGCTREGIRRCTRCRGARVGRRPYVRRLHHHSAASISIHRQHVLEPKCVQRCALVSWYAEHDDESSPASTFRRWQCSQAMVRRGAPRDLRPRDSQECSWCRSDSGLCTRSFGDPGYNALSTRERNSCVGYHGIEHLPKMRAHFFCE